MRIAIAGFSDETCTFCHEPTGIDRYEPWAKRGKAILDENRGIPTYVNGYMKVLEAEGVEIVPILEAHKGPGGFSTWLTPECYDKYTYEIRDNLAKAGKLDGVLMPLHGAMAAETAPRPEAECVRRARQAVGNIPVMVTLDLHANEDQELIDATDGVFVLKTYPHVDSEEIGMIAAKCMVETVRGNFKPTQAMRRPGIISASIYQASEYPPMKLVYDRCREWEKKGVYCASVAPGYAYADVVDCGMSVIVVTNNDQALADKAAQDIADLAWSLKEQFAAPLPAAEEATKLAMKCVAEGKGPVVIADGADRIGDSTYMLEELLKQGTKNWVIPGITDKNAAQYIEKNCKVGDQVTVKVGGWYGEFSNKPVEITGKVHYMGTPAYTLVGPMRHGAKIKEGFVAVLDLGQNRYVGISPSMRGANDSAPLTATNIDYKKLDIIILKDRVHHRAYWDSVAKTDIRTSVPGEGPADITTLHYDNIPKDAYPVGPQWKK
jgi:microcystin degradation protein MlrC